jgi:hypothetical protein
MRIDRRASARDGRTVEAAHESRESAVVAPALHAGAPAPTPLAHGLACETVIALQRTAGNRRVARLLGAGSPPRDGHLNGARAARAALQRQSHGHGATSPAADPAPDLGDPDRLAEHLMRTVVAAERALADPQLPPATRTQLQSALPPAREQLRELLAQLRQARAPSAGPAAVTTAGVSMPMAPGFALAGARGATAPGSAAPAAGGVVEGLGVVGLLVAVLTLGGVYGGGPTITALDDAAVHARQALDAFGAAGAQALVRATSQARPMPIAIPITATARRDECPPGAPVYSPSRCAQIVRELFYDVPARLAARSRTRWRSAGQLRFISVRQSNTAVAVIVDSAGCERASGRGTFIQGDGTVHAEIQALTQVSMAAPVVQPGWSLIVHTSAAPCATICAPAIPAWAALRGLVPRVVVNSKWELMRDDGYLAICQTVINAQPPVPPTTSANERGHGDADPEPAMSA